MNQQRIELRGAEVVFRNTEAVDDRYWHYMEFVSLKGLIQAPFPHLIEVGVCKPDLIRRVMDWYIKSLLDYDGMVDTKISGTFILVIEDGELVDIETGEV